MRKFLALLIAVGLGVAFYKQKAAEQKSPSSEKPVTATAVQPGAGRTPSEHNFAKRALDRAGDVKRQVAQQRKENNAP